MLPLGAAAMASLLLTVWTTLEVPRPLRASRHEPTGVTQATGLTLVASLPSGWHSTRNPAPSRLSWTNGGSFFSSIGSLTRTSTNELR